MAEHLSSVIREYQAFPSRTMPPPDESWEAMIARIQVGNTVHEISDETYDYFLEVLPPHWLGNGAFAFAEGAEPLQLYFQRDGVSYCIQLNTEQTRRFCRAANIAMPS